MPLIEKFLNVFTILIFLSFKLFILKYRKLQKNYLKQIKNNMKKEKAELEIRVLMKSINSLIKEN